MKALIVSLETFRKGTIPEEVAKFIVANKGKVFIILDESSKIKTNTVCKEEKKSKQCIGVKKLNRFGERAILTGTFMSMSPLNAYDQMDFLKKDFFAEGMKAFSERYVVEMEIVKRFAIKVKITKKIYRRAYNTLKKGADTKDPYQFRAAVEAVRRNYGLSVDSCRHILNNPEFTPYKHLDELWERIGDTCLKVDRKDILDTPEKIYKTVKLKLTKEQRKLYSLLQNKHCTDNAIVENGLQLYLHLQNVCNGYEPIQVEDTINEKTGKIKHNYELRPLDINPKLDALELLLEQIGDEQLLVWCSRTQILVDAIERLQEAGYSVGRYDGKVSRAQRDKDYKDFCAGKLKVLLMNESSGAYGLDELQKVNYAVYLCNDPSVERRQQSEDRINRGVVTQSKIIIDLTMSGTCENKVLEGFKIGQQLINSGKADPDLFKLDD